MRKKRQCERSKHTFLSSTKLTSSLILTLISSHQERFLALSSNHRIRFVMISPGGRVQLIITTFSLKSLNLQEEPVNARQGQSHGARLAVLIHFLRSSPQGCEMRCVQMCQTQAHCQPAWCTDGYRRGSRCTHRYTQSCQEHGSPEDTTHTHNFISSATLSHTHTHTHTHKHTV